MNTQKPDSPLDDWIIDAGIPYHPYFETAQTEPNFGDCADAIDRAVAVIEPGDYLRLEEEQADLSPNAAYGCYWGTEMTRPAFAYAGVEPRKPRTLPESHGGPYESGQEGG